MMNHTAHTNNVFLVACLLVTILASLFSPSSGKTPDDRAFHDNRAGKNVDADLKKKNEN